jgi:thiol-disulfide isomerase/thioredoxin
MKRHIRFSWMALALSLTVAVTLIVANIGVPGEKTIASPKIIAIKFHADWCGYCKAMGSVFTDLTNKFDGKPVLFVTLDLTNRTTQHQAELLASALGVGDIYQENQGTGFIMLVDGQTREVSGRLTSNQTLKEMGDEINKLLAE